MEAFLIATGLVTVAEIGDKTQLLALLLVARYRRPWPILAAIAVATLANHAIAGLLGGLLAQTVPDDALRWIIGLGFLVMAWWALHADHLDPDAGRYGGRGWGVFAVALLSFFLAEIGDKTQIATLALAARYDHALVAVVAGSTLGMLLANAPVLLAGQWLLARLPLVWIRRFAALAFAALGLAILLRPLFSLD